MNSNSDRRTEKSLGRLSQAIFLASLNNTAAAIMFFYPGIPCVYYGDEIGMEGGYDPDCRRTFRWNEESWDKETRNLIKQLMKLKKEPALSDGLFGIEEKDGIITIARRTEEQTLLLRVNGTDRVNAGLPAYGFEIKEEL